MSTTRTHRDPLLAATYIVGCNNIRLACYSAGNPASPTIVFVHGYPDTHSIWRRMIHALQADYHCVCYDVRGAGASERPQSTKAYKLDKLATDLARVIDWASPHAPVHVIAHDWGSIQSWEAVTDPAMTSRIASFTSVSGPCLDHVGHLLRARWRQPLGLLKQLGKSWYIGAMHIPGTAAQAIHEALARRWSSLSRRLEGEALPHNPTHADDGVAGIKLYRANMGPRLMRPRHRHTRIPVQMIQPLRDPFVGPELVNGLEQWVDQLTVHTLEGGHWAIYSRARVVASHARAFIQRTERIVSASVALEQAQP